MVPNAKLDLAEPRESGDDDEAVAWGPRDVLEVVFAGAHNEVMVLLGDRQDTPKERDSSK
jgi:hypothetical protein